MPTAGGEVMLNELLSLTRPLFVLDTETTGTDTRTDRIIELGFQHWDSTGLVKEYRTLINPGVPIPFEASKVHGIYDADMLKCQACGLLREMCKCETTKVVPYFKQLAPHFARGFVDCDYAGQNVRFDLQILFNEMVRAGVTWTYRGARVIDSLKLEGIAVPRSLSHLHEKYAGKPHDGAHGALSDVRASTTVIVHQLERYRDALPRDLDRLHDMQWPHEFLDGEGKFRMVNGVATCSFGKKYNGKAMKDIDKSFWDWILGADFGEDVKQLARDAKLGKFPER